MIQFVDKMTDFVLVSIEKVDSWIVLHLNECILGTFLMLLFGFGSFSSLDHQFRLIFKLSCPIFHIDHQIWFIFLLKHSNLINTN